MQPLLWGASVDRRTLLLHILSEIKGDIDLYRALFSKGNDLYILEQFLSMSLEKTERVLVEQGRRTPGIQSRWSSHYGSYGCMGVIQCWIEDGLSQAPEEVADFIVGILTKTMA